MIKFLALGDSYTVGEAVALGESWPAILATELRRDGLAMADPTILARTGWTTYELLCALKGAAPSQDHSLVSLQIGVNDQYRGESLETYRTSFSDLLRCAIHLAGKKASSVVVVSIPDWGVTPFAKGRNRQAIATRIDEFNAVNFEVSQRAGTYYVDVTGISREIDTAGNLLARDGLHPSAKMYKRWADMLVPIARKILLELRSID